MIQWISVKDRLPEPGEIVLVHQVYSWQQFEDGVAVTVGRLRPTENGRVSYWEFQYYRPDFRDGTVLDNGIICPGNEYITHWMPLPEPPEKEDKLTADVAPVRHGRWVEPQRLYYGAKQYECSLCYSDTFWKKHSITEKYPCCPNCGAKMDGGAD